ncbi:hypothetical protein ACFSC4_12935 [Deinococcus malanensis]|uniref:hypothetical protein n=1 Tax=Deinococcus malanensis TaxID=1706855 RepID=UPI00362D8AD8
MAELDRVREALRASMTAWATLEVRGDQARVIPAPDPDQLAAHLSSADPAWTLTWACDSAQPPVVRARLTLAGVTREGLATGHTLGDAKLAALADAARVYGVPAGDTAWVEFDPDEGANTTDLDAEAPCQPHPARRPCHRNRPVTRRWKRPAVTSRTCWSSSRWPAGRRRRTRPDARVWRDTRREPRHLQRTPGTPQGLGGHAQIHCDWRRAC